MLKNKSAKTIFIICKILNDSFMYMCVYIYIYIHVYTYIYTHMVIQHIYIHIRIYAFIPPNFWGSQLIKMLWFWSISAVVSES